MFRLKVKFGFQLPMHLVPCVNTLVVSIGLTHYFTSYRGMSAGLVVTVWIIFGIWNAVNDLLFGYISDRSKNMLGRRIPCIRFGVPLFDVIFVLFWVNFGGVQASQTILFIQMTLLLFLFDDFTFNLIFICLIQIFL